MFDIGFWELALIGVIALLVVGPERLPALARKVGLWVGRMRRYVAHVREDIEREIHADEVRKLIETPSHAIGGIGEAIAETKSVFTEAEQQLTEVEREAGRIEDALDDSFAAAEAGAEEPAAGEVQSDGPFGSENTEQLSPTQDQPGAATGAQSSVTETASSTESEEEKRHAES